MAKPSTEEVPAQLRYHDKPPGRAVARVIRYDRPMRVGRALRAFGACWGLAVACVFIPVLHFILVPAFAIGGPLLALQRLGERAVLVGAAGVCPVCEKQQDFRLHPSKLGTPVPHRCEACGRALLLETPPEEAAPGKA